MERSGARKERAAWIAATLASTWPDARIALEYDSPFHLLVAVLLSAQCTDLRVNLVTPALMAAYPNPAAMARAEREAVEELVRPCGLFRAKARALIALGQLLEERHGGAVPTRRAELAELPGVGNKTAGVVALQLSGEPAFPVDTHVARLAMRLGLSSARNPDRIEADLKKLFPVESWGPTHHRLIWHGRRVCLARAPRCGACSLEPRCPKRGVITKEGAR